MLNSVGNYDPSIALLSGAVLLALFAMTVRRFNRVMRMGVRRPRPPVASADYGLLVAVATASTRADADMLRDVLAGHGIRATIAAADPDDAGREQLLVLVFPADAGRARDLVASR